jgi:DNA invertase Pin-like site-specific DNA recombinase
MMRKTAIYARYSSHAQDGSTSIEVQLEACGRGLEPASILEYIDRAKTGRAVAGREALLRLLADAEDGKVERVLVYKYDRVGRNLAETSAIIAQLEDCGVEVVSVTEGKDALARGMHLVISEHYSRVLAERTRDGLVKRFEQGAWTGGPPPYGYSIEKTENGLHRLMINEEEAAVVQWVFQTYTTESVGCKEIARRLQGRGISPRRASRWAFTGVRGMLVNSICTGRLAYNRRRFKVHKQTGRRVAVRKDEADHLVHQDERLRIIDDKQFQEAQQRLAGRRRGRPGPYLRSEARPFTGLIVCETCGSICYRRKSKNAKGEYHYYGCGCRQRHGPDACENKASIREDLLLQEVTRTFKDLFEDADSIIEEATEEARRLMRKNRGAVRRIGGQLAEIEKKVASLTRLLCDPDIDVAAKKAISRQLGEQEAERERLQKATSELAEEANDGTERLAASVRQALDEAKESLASAATTAELREFVDRWVGPMVLKPNGTVVERTLAPEVASEAGVKGLVAGAGFEPATFGL